MGGWMTYGRVRNRNHLPRPQHPEDPYSTGEQYGRAHLIAGDLNRMERDYLDPTYPQPPWATRPEGSDPSAECAAATGLDVETVRKVLSYVFRESR